MKKIIGGLVAVGFLFGFASNASAKGYADAGCGLGALAWKTDNNKWKQVLAATTNGTGMQTFGISTGTSRCGGSGGDVSITKAFIETNREAFAKDASRASGETISGLASLAGCKDEQAVGNTLQQEFQSVFPNAQAKDTEVSENVIQTLRAHPELGCTNIS